ncbi:MAG: pirin family protein, partial [Rhodospirillales bacterium]|nr:pirin family protein [Rhodospirillales bacterium]
MSWQPVDSPDCPTPPAGVDLVLLPRAHDIGGFEVRRALPARERQMVGPFIFFDQMGPGEFLAGKGLDVRPHPHVGLSTVTYLFEGEILHRDSLGSRQPIVPGDVNWMTAGAGIVHSERTDPARRGQANRLFGIQSWVALPKAQEERAPGFAHHPATSLPTGDADGLRLRLIAGTGWGLAAPVAVASDLFYADAVLAPNAAVPLPEEHEERAAYVVQGEVDVAGDRFESGRMLVFRAGDRLALRAGPEGARLLLLGGAAMDGPRYLFWNFVASSRERIEQAKADWKAARFGTVPGDDQEFIPLPEL